MKVKRHFPMSFIDFAQNETIIFEINPTLEDLLSLPFVESAEKDKDFYRFSVGNKGYSKYPICLMAEYENGKHWYVIAHLEHMIEGLPEWVCPAKE